MYRRILAVLDGSRSAERVLPHAQALVERFGATLSLLWVTGPGDAERRKADHYLAGVHARLTALGLMVHYQRAEGRPTELILEQARNQDADLIVLATEEGLADAVIPAAPCPVLLVPPVPLPSGT
jgi:nucleotide-binding universal stress UspA family protein